MDIPPVQLTVEQLLSLSAFEARVRMMSREQAQLALVKLYEQAIRRENELKEQLRQEWGIAAPPPQEK